MAKAKISVTTNETKTEVKTTSVKKAPKKAKATVKTPAVKEEKSNINIVDEVLKIKATNEEKKIKKTASKAKTKEATVKENTIQEKSSQRVANISKKEEIKNNIKKADAKKFAELKQEQEEPVASCCCCKCCCSRFKESFFAWVDGYKKMFDFQTRTSRFEFWSFMLLNVFFFTLLGIISGTAFALSPEAEDLSIVSMFLVIAITLVEFVAYLSLSVRRLHDTGNFAFKGFYGPLLVYSILLIATILYIYSFIGKVVYNPELSTLQISSIILLVILCVLSMYYSTKIMITSYFIEEDKAENQFGTPVYTDACHIKATIKYIAVYIVYTTLLYALVNVLFKAIMLFSRLSQTGQMPPMNF